VRAAGCSAPIWKTAEKIKSEALRETAEQEWKTHCTVPSPICLYHAALECFIEEIALALARSNDDPTTTEEGHAIQDMTLHEQKFEKFTFAPESSCGAGWTRSRGPPKQSR
jgi:hypothetical protein